jgi:hypothetical protein
MRIVAQTTSLTYQGWLSEGGTPVSGNNDLRFTLWDILDGGIQQPQPAQSPRQQITSTPYAIRSLTAAVADTATNATQVGRLSGY